MKTGGIALCLLVLVLSVYAHHDEPNPTPFTAGNQVTATIFPCNHHYWYTTGFQGSAVGTYARIDFNWTSYQVADDPTIWVGAGFIPTERQWTDTCTLNTPATGCTFYDICRVPGNTAYVTVDGGHRDAASYAFTVASRSTNPTNLGTITGNTATKSLYTRANNQDLKFEPPQYYDHYYLATPTYQPGMYLVVNITKVASNVTTSWPSLYVNWNGLATVETNCVSTGCLSSTDNTGSCTCSSDASTDNCGVVVRPCAFAKNGTYFFSVLIPENTRVNYTISAAYYYPYVLQLTNGVIYQYTADGGRSGHHVLKVNASQITNSSRLRVTVNNVVGGGVNIYVQKGELAGGKDGCHTAIRTCTTSWACDIYVPSCVFGAGDWYVAVDAAATTNYRLPLSYSIQATIVPEPGVLALTPGDVIVTSIKENDYHFYSVDIPNTANTWLYAELYLNRNDSEVWFSMHPGSIVGPAGYCYPEPPADNWTCSTGGDSNNREACYFHLQTCYLQPGTVYFTVWQKNYTAYGHPLTKYNTFYAIPTEYTLRITLDQPRMVLNNISYSEHVYANHYQHYYLPIDNVVTGEHLTVHFANVQRGTITGYVYLNDLAGECPCYKNIRNCTASAPGGWCDLQIDTCLFQSGVWYISARGWPVADNAVVPIGYTLTVIRNPAPPIWDLTLDNTIWNTMGWNESHHYKLPVPSSSYTDNLVIKIILDQDQGKAYQLHNLVAYNKFPSWYEDYWTHHCYEEYCFTNVGSNSYCTIRIRACDWNALVRGGDWYLSVYGTGWNQNDPRALYTIRTFLEADPVQALTSGSPVYDKVQNFGWRHYYLDLTNGTGANNMFVEIYTNNDQDLVTFRMNVNNVAGVIYDTNPSWSPCTNYLKPYECNTTTSCAWQIQNCILQPAIYYFSVYGLSRRWEDPRYAQQYYDIPVEYTLTVTLYSQVQTLQYETPVAGYLVKGGLNQYQITIPTLNYTNNGFQYFVLETANARHGTVKTYVRHGPTGAKLAGPCPCYEWDWRYDTADNGAVGSLILPYCWLKGNEGLYTIAVEDITPDTDAGRTSTTLDLTPTAYTLTASLITPTMQTNYTVGSTVTGHVLGNNRYWHYQLNGLSTATLPQQLQIFVYNVKNGAVTVYLNPTYGAAVGTASDCAAWTAGSCSGTQCQWYVPECIWGTNGTWWLSVKGSASLNVTYDLGTKLVTPTTLGSVTWFNQINQYGFADQYKFTVASSNNNPYIVVDITNATAALNVYVNSQSMAGSNACKSCVHTVSYDNSASTTTLCSAGTCKFRIPSCSTKAGDWYIVVAPVVAAATNYSIKWAQYDSSASNTPVSTFTPATITLSKIESWQMFSVPITNAAATPSQLIISATWGTGSASVKMYVNHTNLVGGSTCGDWVCDSDSSPSGCTFTLDSCCVQSTTYRFGFFQTSEGTRDITYNVQQWSEHGTSALTIGTSGYTTTTDSEGVAESTYRFFRMNIPNTVITSSQTVYLNISILSQTSAGALQVYLRPNYQAGQLGRCYDSVATATATFASPAIIELQGCLLSNTDWYIGLYNPATQVSKPGDSKPVYFSAWASTYSPIAANVGANAWINATVDSTNVLAAQSWVHFSFNVDASSISYNKNSLKVEIIPLVGTISTLYLNYGSLAGSNITLGNIACAGNCFSSAAPTLSITVPSCTLRSGTWYAAAKVAGSTTQYAFRAQIVSQNYVALGAPTQVGTDPLAYRYNLIQQSLTNPAVAGTQFVYYSFSITSDMIRPTTKLSINVTDVSSGTVQVSVYKDCSLQWTVSTVSSAVIADKTKMGPCDLQAGEYLIVVQADAVPAVTGWYANYTVAVFLRDATNYTLDMTGLVGRDHDHVFTNYHDVWNINVPQLTNANQTLAINFNVSCGAITAYLNYGTPGGPGCNIASCSSSMTTGTNPSTRYDTTCTMFLDTCQVQPGVYYVTVVGAGQEFTSQYLYQQVNYEIWATPTYYNYTAIAPDTWYGYTGAIKTNASTAYVANQLTNDWRQYWYVDEETSNPGSRLKFTLYGNTSDSLYVAYENAFGAVNGASNAKCTAPSSCTIASGATTCTVTINSCALKIGRYFLLAKVASYPANWYWDRVRAWRQEVDIPYLWPGQAVTGTVGDDYPQYYKILVINPSDTEFYGDFRVYNVDLGSVTATLSHVIYGSQTPGQQAGCLSSTGKTACTAALNSNCSVHIAPCYAFANLTYFLEIDAATHDNANRSVRYSLVYTLRPPVMSLPLNTRVCDTVHLNEYRHWKLSPQASNLEDILLVNITTLYSPETVSLSLNDYPNRLGVEDGSTNSYGQCWRNYWSGASPDTVTSTGLTTYYECAYTDFHIGVRGKTVNDNLIGIKYLIEARVNPAPVITLTLGTPAYYCASNRYYFKVTVPANVTFFEVLVSTEDTSKSATVWVKQGSLAAPNCYDKTATGAGLIGTWNIQTCGLPAGVYYITVSSPNTPFVITAKTSNKAITQVGNSTAVTGTAMVSTADVDATVPIYSINVTSTQIATTNTPQLDFWLTYNTANGGLAISNIYFGSTNGTAASTCDVAFTVTRVTQSTWKYTVKNCYLRAGTYYAFLKSTSTDCLVAPSYALKSGTVSYSLTAAVTQTIAPTPIPLNVVQNNTIQSNVVQHYYINGTQSSGRFLYVRIFNVPTAYPLTVTWSLFKPVDPTATGCVNAGTTSRTNDWTGFKYYATNTVIGSEVFRIDTCNYTPTDKVYFAISSSNADGCTNQPFGISYNFVVYETQWTPLTALSTTTETINDNRELRFYSISTSSMQAVTVRVTPTTADGKVSISVQDNECDTSKYIEYQWTKDCVPGQYCDIEIPTRAAHPEKGKNTFYIIVKSNRANYTITWFAGTQNCGNPSFTSTSFCGTDVVNYATWNWNNNWQALDTQARGLFEKLYLDFHYSRDFPCYVNCNTSLRQYACHETFRMCDTAGFITPVCKASCDHVVYYCQNWFDTVQVREMNCTSHQYGDAYYGNCTGLDVKVPYPPNSFVNIQGAVAGASLLAPSVLVLLALLALYLL